MRFVSSSGITPVSLLLPRFRMDSRSRFPREAGMLPDRRLSHRLRLQRFVRLPSSSGISSAQKVPAEIQSYSELTICPSSAGIAPLRWAFLISR